MIRGFLIFGERTAFGGTSNLSALDAVVTSSVGRVVAGLISLADLDGTTGFVLNGVDERDFSGTSVSIAGDVNGDGFDDLLIGAQFADPYGTESGASYVVFGGNFTGGLETQVGTSSADTLTGNATADVLIGGRAADLLLGNGGADALYGGEGDDMLAISDLTFRRVAGGNGSDTLRLDGSGLTLDLTTVADNTVTDIEVIDITGSGANTLTLDFQEVVNISSHSNTLLVRRDAGDAVNIGDGWTPQPDETIGGSIFNVFTQGAATLKVQEFTRPTVIVNIVDASLSDADNSSSVTFEFSEDVTGFDINDLTPTNGTLSNFQSVDGNSFTATLTADDGIEATGSVSVGTGYASVAGNSGTVGSDTVAIDTLNPTADIVDVTPDPRRTTVGTVTINFSESVTGVDITDFHLTRDGDSVDISGLSVTGSGDVYEVNLSTVTESDGQYVLSLTAVGSAIHDAAGNAISSDVSDQFEVNREVEVVLPAGGGNYEILRDGSDLVARIQGGAELFRADISTVLLMTITGSAAAETVTVLDTGTAVVTPLRIFGGGDDDRLDAAAATGSVTLDGGEGNDVIIGGANDDQLTGGPGNDTFDGRGGHDTALDRAAGDGVAGLFVNVNLRLLSTRTPTDANGEFATLAQEVEYVDEWDDIVAELTADTLQDATSAVGTFSVDVPFDAALFEVVAIDYGPSFTEDQTATIDSDNGRITGLSARTTRTDAGQDSFLILARVNFRVRSDVNLLNNLVGTYILPTLDEDFRTEQLATDAADRSGALSDLTGPTAANIWPVMYDLDDSGTIGFGDVAVFAQNFGRARTSPGVQTYASNFPNAWEPQALRTASTLSPAVALTEPAHAAPTAAQLEQRKAVAVEQLRLAGSQDIDPDALHAVSVRVEDLPDGYLGISTADAIIIDADAAGAGWFIDESPEDDSEFATNPQTAVLDPFVRDRFDLLSVIAHELGHHAGLEHDDGFMADRLEPGQRRLPDTSVIDDPFADLSNLDELLGLSNA